MQDIAEQLGYSVVILDDATDKPLSAFMEYIYDDSLFIPAFGNNHLRLEWIRKIVQSSGKLATLIHPSAYVSPKAKIETGTVVLPKSVINTDVIIKQGCIINIGAMIDHGCIIEEGVHICCGAIVKGENQINSCSKIEAGEIIELRQCPIK